jgi:hypothetical protein
MAQTARKSVLLVGNPSLPLKGFDVALKVLASVDKTVPITVTWVCQSLPTALQLPGLATCGLSIKFYVSPPQVACLAPTCISVRAGRMK